MRVRHKAPIAPESLVSLYGPAIGASQAAHANPGSSGKIDSQLAGTQVLFDGIPAPILNSAPGRIDAVVPFEVATSGNSSMSVLQDGAILGTLTATLAPYEIRPFSTDGAGFGAVF
jgi:uncharacterized protein (TIGR03437 family)